MHITLLFTDVMKVSNLELRKHAEIPMEHLLWLWHGARQSNSNGVLRQKAALLLSRPLSRPVVKINSIKISK